MLELIDFGLQALEVGPSGLHPPLCGPKFGFTRVPSTWEVSVQGGPLEGTIFIKYANSEIG
jgi:hypothetical protein